MSKLTLKQAKVNLKEAKENITTLRTKFKTAQEGGTLSPEETKDMSLQILDLVEEVAEIAGNVAEGVPSEGVSLEDDDSITNGDNETNIGGDHGLSERINQGQEDEDDDEKLDLKNKIAKLNTVVETMQKEAKQEKLAIQYAKHFPINQREAKQKEFAKSTESLPILEARLKEAKTFFKSPSLIKEAALQDSTFDITEMPENNTTGGLDFGGKF